MLNFIKLVKQIKHDYLKGKLKERYIYQDLIAISITPENAEEYEIIEGTFLEEAAYNNNLWEITNTKEEFFLFVTMDEYGIISSHIF